MSPSHRRWCWAAPLLLLGGIVGAVPPAPGWEGPRGLKTCFVNRPALARRAQALQGAPASLLAPPVPLNPRVIVLQVQSLDSLFPPGLDPGIFFQKVRDYFEENSYGVFVPTFTLSAVFTLPESLRTYGANCGEDIACNSAQLITDAIAAADPTVDFTSFEHVMVYHAGYGEESTGNTSDIWSLYYPAEEMPLGILPTLDGKFFDGATIVPEREFRADALGVICHEYGHQLGLPDLYDTSVPGGQSTVGAWDLMDYPYTGLVPGANPPHLGAFSKRFLGFGSVVSVSSGTFSLGPAEVLPGGAVEIFRSGADNFLVEYRLASAAEYDQYLPQSAGLAVWHVDDSIALDEAILNANVVNAPSLNGRGHRGVDLVEADGTEANPAARDLGRGNGFVDGQTLVPPKTDLFSGAPTNLLMLEIEGVGTGLAQANLLFFKSGPSQSVARALSYPNPATGQAPVGSAPGTWATLRAQLTRPVSASSLKANVFTMGGERVRRVPGAAFALREEISRDYEWVYEYDWDGRDESGEPVASGVYLLVFEADGETGKNKIVIQR